MSSQYGDDENEFKYTVLQPEQSDHGEKGYNRSNGSAEPSSEFSK